MHHSQVSPRADVLLVTVTDIETDAMRDVYREQSGRTFSTVFIGDKTYYDLGMLGGAQTFLVRSEMGTGGIGGALLTISTAINHLTPSAIIMLGIAFGLNPKRQQLGDILISRQLMLYELQRVGTDANGGYQIHARGDRPACSLRLLDRFRTGRDEWRGAPLHFGLVLSGDKLVDNQDFRNQLLQLEPEAIGGEMEGAGLYAAAQRHKVDWILVKAISDWADGRKRRGKATNQRLAAHNAAAFTLHVIGQGGVTEQPPEAVSRATPPASALISTTSIAGSLNQIRLLLTERMNLQEIQTVCSDLGINYDELSGEGRTAKIREMIGYLERRQSRDRLLEWIRQNRPDIEL